MFRRKKRKPPGPKPTEPIYHEVKSGKKEQWAMFEKGRTVIVNQVRSRSKHIHVSIRNSPWIERLAKQGKRPLGTVRRCDLVQR